MSPSDPGLSGIWEDLLAANPAPGRRAATIEAGTDEFSSCLKVRGFSAQSIDSGAPGFPSTVAGAPFDLVAVPDTGFDVPETDRWLVDLVAQGGILALSSPNGEGVCPQIAAAVRRLQGRTAVRLSTLADTSDRFAALGLSIVQVRFYDDGSLAARIASLFLPSRRTKSRFAAVFRRSS